MGLNCGGIIIVVVVVGVSSGGRTTGAPKLPPHSGHMLLRGGRAAISHRLAAPAHNNANKSSQSATATTTTRDKTAARTTSGMFRSLPLFGPTGRPTQTHTNTPTNRVACQFKRHHDGRRDSHCATSGSDGATFSHFMMLSGSAVGHRFCLSRPSDHQKKEILSAERERKSPAFVQSACFCCLSNSMLLVREKQRKAGNNCHILLPVLLDFPCRISRQKRRRRLQTNWPDVKWRPQLRNIEQTKEMMMQSFCSRPPFFAFVAALFGHLPLAHFLPSKLEADKPRMLLGCCFCSSIILLFAVGLRDQFKARMQFEWSA